VILIPDDPATIEYLDRFVCELTDAEVEELNRLSNETREDPVSWNEFKLKLGL
jgi:hypothetical protein